jgi:uncharacterized protein
MGRILFFALVFVALYLAWKSMMRKAEIREDERRPRPTAALGEDMVTCTRCGVNVPRSEAKDEGGRLVCADNPRCRGTA